MPMNLPGNQLQSFVLVVVFGVLAFFWRRSALAAGCILLLQVVLAAVVLGLGALLGAHS